MFLYARLLSVLRQNYDTTLEDWVLARQRNCELFGVWVNKEDMQKLGLS
jgi:hypothetical protein